MDVYGPSPPLLRLHRALQCEGPGRRRAEAGAQQGTGGGVVLHTERLAQLGSLKDPIGFPKSGEEP